MPTLSRPIHTLLSLSACVLLGVATVLWAAQEIWIEANKVRINAYARSLLGHAENVAASLTEALTILNDTSEDSCSDKNLKQFKAVVFTHSFIRDAGVVTNNKIKCTAIWGELHPEHLISEQGHLTRNQITLWHNASPYVYPFSTMDISAKNGFFVVTSKDAFSAHESNSSISANITSTDNAINMRSFGDQTPLRREPNPIRLCSQRFDFCVNATINNSIFTWEKLSITATLASAGIALGLLLWYSIIQFLKNRNTLAIRLAKAIKKGNVNLVYQPIIDASSGKISGFEALARWSDKLEGAVPPDIFIKLADELDLSAALSKSIINKAISECAATLHANPQVYLSLNLSTSELIDEEILTHLVYTCSKNGICNSQIAIELLETSTASLDLLQNRIQDYRHAGYLVFIDDFGTGYSSLAYLSRLSIDKIKIDKIFTQSVGSVASADMILIQINEIARSIGAKVIYEGIETKAQLDAILAFNTQAFAQGWLFSKAIPIEQLREKINLFR